MKKITLTISLIISVMLINAENIYQNFKIQKNQIGFSNSLKPGFNSNHDLNLKQFMLDENINIGIGAGIGIPYGVFGGNLFVIVNHFGGSLGLGIYPLTWNSVYTATASIYILEPSSNFKPKLSLSYSNDVAEIMFLDESLNLLYNEVFSGVAAYAGAAIKFKEDGNVGIDFNIGYLFINGGSENFIEKYNDEKEILENQGWDFPEATVTASGIKLSMGLLYFF